MISNPNHIVSTAILLVDHLRDVAERLSHEGFVLLMAEIRRSPVEVGSCSMFFPLFIGF